MIGEEDVMTPEQFLGALRLAKTIAVIRASTEIEARRACEELVNSGIGILEITFSVPNADRLIYDLRREMPSSVLVGAGTVLAENHVQRACRSGAQFLVSPIVDESLMESMKRSDLPFLAGALTPTEVNAATRAGAAAVKIFPAHIHGLAGLRSLREIFPDVAFVPTGGIDPDSRTEWLSAGAVAVGIGKALAPEVAQETVPGVAMTRTCSVASMET